MFKRDPRTARMGKEIWPFEMGYLPEFFQKKAEVELKDTLENRQKGMVALKELIANDKHFDGCKFDDDFLLQYLICRKFNTKRAFTQLKAFVNLRKSHKSLFKDFIFEKIAMTIKSEFFVFLPYRCQDGCAIILVQLNNWIPEEFPMEEVKRMVTIFILQSLRDPMTQVNGFKVIYDLQTDPTRHLKFITPSNMYLMHHGTEECFPGRFAGVHVLNRSLIFKAAWAILKIFISQKMKERVHLHDTTESLLDFFPASILPEKYGGDLKDYDMMDWLRNVMSPEKLATLGGNKHPST